MKNKKLLKSAGNLSVIAFSAVLGAWTSGFYNIKLYGREIEEVKSDLVIEQMLVDMQLKTIESLSLKAGELFQYSANYRQYDLLPESLYPTELQALVKTMKPARVTPELMEKINHDFQVSLFASKPFISEEVYMQLAKYAKAMNHFNYSETQNSKELKDMLEFAGLSYSKSLDIIREQYYREI